MINSPKTDELTEKLRKGNTSCCVERIEYRLLASQLEHQLGEALAENERLKEEVTMMRECIISTEDTAGQRE